MQVTKKAIRDLTKKDISLIFAAWGEPPYRADQVHHWLWQQFVKSFDEMRNIPKALQNKLAAEFDIFPIQSDLEQVSSDGTIKCRFRLHDGHLMESVLIPADDRMTACVSSQVGCNLGCKFCATGFIKMKRNLAHYEIYDQVVSMHQHAMAHYGKPLSNIVYMGMGEPLLNYKNVIKSVERITAADGLAMSPRRITVSTAGLAKQIKQLGDDGVKFNLAVSLHAADDKKRSALMPVNDANNLQTLIDALNYFYAKTKNKITFEYILFDGINETAEDARNLVKLCRRVPAKVNIIEYNPIAQADFNKSKEEQREKFIAYLEQNDIVAKVRRSRGKDIDAACGQLANK
ncbi:MAG: 23S rRNA (adenine(2503)-C(2))-methyltransferase RlmN [Chitinophagales bacterium]